MFDKYKTVCFSGHRTKRLPQSPQGLKELKKRVYEEIDKAVSSGFNSFIFGGCLGFDLICAEVLLDIKNVSGGGIPRQIQLIAAIPFEKQAERWNLRDRELYNSILSRCDDIVCICEEFSLYSYSKRNRFMVDNSSRLICYYDGGKGGTAATVKYANKKGLEIINLC
ncbi:MAG: SLOG family protein [Oscillospiraceae bacterium]|nr:SLOG family protein [Oscillospiraceae bacterium]MDD4414785.1 SLOG family protein [Oscillospiraceae bacterium]